MMKCPILQSLFIKISDLDIGTAMTKEIPTLLKSYGYNWNSLSIQKANYAAKIYLKIGFEIVRKNVEEYIMVYHL